MTNSFASTAAAKGYSVPEGTVRLSGWWTDSGIHEYMYVTVSRFNTETQNKNVQYMMADLLR